MSVQRKVTHQSKATDHHTHITSKILHMLCQNIFDTCDVKLDDNVTYINLENVFNNLKIV